MQSIRCLRATLVAALSLLAISDAAQAGTVELAIGANSEADLLYGIGSNEADSLSLSGTSTSEEVVITPAAGTTLALLDGDTEVESRCEIGTDGSAICDLTGLGATSGPTILSGQLGFWMGPGDDTVIVDPALTTDQVLGLALVGEAGNDDLQGGAGPDVLAGDSPEAGDAVSGHDRLRGGKGSDYFDAGPGNDMVFANEGLDGKTTIPDSATDDGPSVCGTGTDFLIFDDHDATRLRSAASCEARRSSTDGATGFGETRIVYTPDHGRFEHEVGQVLTVRASSTLASAPTDFQTTWVQCASKDAASCTDLATAPSLTIQSSMIGSYVGVRSVYGWRIPENPWGYWPGRTELRISMKVGTAVGPVNIPEPATAATTLAELLRVMVPANPLRLSTLANTQIRGDGNWFKTTSTATLSVSPAALGKRGKKRIIIASASNTALSNVRLTLRLNAQGKQLLKRMKKSSAIKAKYTVNLAVGDAPLKGARTVNVTLKK